MERIKIEQDMVEKTTFFQSYDEDGLPEEWVWVKVKFERDLYPFRAIYFRHSMKDRGYVIFQSIEF